jgi:hypothetical protein
VNRRVRSLAAHVRFHIPDLAQWNVGIQRFQLSRDRHYDALGIGRRPHDDILNPKFNPGSCRNRVKICGLGGSAMP